MKEQTFLTLSQLREQFDLAVEKTTANWDGNGTAFALKMLSQAINDLQGIGLDVRLQISSTLFQDVWALANKVMNNDKFYAYVSASGILKVNNSEFLLAITTHEGQTDMKQCVKIFISYCSFAGQSLRNDHRGNVFDLLNDSEAMQKFQKEVIERAAREAVVNANDICDAFEKRDAFEVPTVPKAGYLPKP